MIEKDQLSRKETLIFRDLMENSGGGDIECQLSSLYSEEWKDKASKEDLILAFVEEVRRGNCFWSDDKAHP